jgi:hypothetical protein
VRVCAAGVFIIVLLAMPLAVTAVAADVRPSGPIVTGPDLNMTGVDITNHSIPARYEVSPTLIDIKVEVSGTSLPGPKGEMAAGPRSIGFSADPFSLAMLVIAIGAITAGTWYIIKRKPEEFDEDGDDESHK